MPRSARLSVGVLVLLALVAFKAQQAGPLFGSATPDAFPRDVVVVAAPSADLFGTDAELRVTQLLNSMNVMWATAFTAAGASYEPPLADALPGPPAEGCGSTAAGWAGIYCARDEHIVIDISSQAVRRAAMGEDGADDLLGYVLAHEVGHHVQAQRGRIYAVSAGNVLKSELHAQCLAGLWGHATGRPLPHPDTYAADADHGTVDQQRRWLELGHRTGRPADCDTIWDGAP